ncbi:MAG: hypothetical protein QXD48_00415 [Candidatus Aenigmatarchaeota archaeon]
MKEFDIETELKNLMTEINEYREKNNLCPLQRSHENYKFCLVLNNYHPPRLCCYFDKNIIFVKDENNLIGSPYNLCNFK